MYKIDLAFNDLQWLICHKTKANETKPKTVSIGIVLRKLSKMS